MLCRNDNKKLALVMIYRLHIEYLLITWLLEAIIPHTYETSVREYGPPSTQKMMNGATFYAHDRERHHTAAVHI